MSNCDEETLNKTKSKKPTKVRFSNEAGKMISQSNRTAQVFNNSANTTPPTHPPWFAHLCLFFRTMLGILTSKDAVQQEVVDCFLNRSGKQCRQISLYIQKFWRDMHVKWGYFCVDDWIAFPNLNKEAYVEAIHATHYAGGWQIFLVAVIAQQSCLQDSKVKPLHLSESKLEIKKAIFKAFNEKFRINFGGPIQKKKTQKLYFLACVDRFSNPKRQKFFKIPANYCTSIFTKLYFFTWCTTLNKYSSTKMSNRPTNSKVFLKKMFS